MSRTLALAAPLGEVPLAALCTPLSNCLTKCRVNKGQGFHQLKISQMPQNRARLGASSDSRGILTKFVQVLRLKATERHPKA
jgi:hypothetical protein